MRLFGEEADPNANMFTDEVMDYVIAHTSDVGEEQILRDMRVNHKSAFAQLWDGSDLTKDEKQPLSWRWPGQTIRTQGLGKPYAYGKITAAAIRF